MEKPWEYNATKVPDNILPGQKIEYRRWCTNPTTKHAFISGCEALDPHRRVSSDGGNPVHKLHAIIVDYDAKHTDSEIEEVLRGDKWPSEYPPTWIASSFSVGHIHAVWILEEPLPIANDAQFKKLMHIVQKKIKMEKWFGGFEAGSMGDSAHYYQIGTNWRAIDSNAVIPRDTMAAWAYEASKDLKLDKDSVAVPMDRISAEVERRFPGRWKGEFREGARGVRFWDETATDPTGSVVLAGGMMAFSGEQAFIPWVKIFGQKFMDEFQADRLAPVLDNVRYLQKGDTGTFYVRGYDVTEPDQWHEVSTKNLSVWLEKRGFNAMRGKKGELSEVADVMGEITQQRAIYGARPFLYHPPGVIVYKGSKVLNTSKARVITPAPADQYTCAEECINDMQFLWSFMSGLFEPLSYYYNPNIQFEVLLSWLKMFYQGGYKLRPVPGQAIFFAGNVSKGKTFYLMKILGPLMGGERDASNFLVHGSPWSDALAETPVAWIDDVDAVKSHESRQAFSSKLKALTANPHLFYNEKFKKAGDVVWLGRTHVNLNLDAYSSRMLPDADGSLKDKVIFLKLNDKRDDGFKFNPDRYVNEDRAAKELPVLARFLLDYWKIPEQLNNVDDPRFGIFSFKHPALHKLCNEQGPTRELKETINDWLQLETTFGDSDKVKVYTGDLTGKSQKKFWVGTTHQLFVSLSSVYACVMNKWHLTRLGTCLGILASRSNIERETIDSENVWKIPLGGIKLTSTEEDELDKKLAKVGRLTGNAEQLPTDSEVDRIGADTPAG